VPLIQVKLIEGVFTGPQKLEIVERLSEAMIEVAGESMRRVTWCMVEEGRERRLGHRRPGPHHRRPSGRSRAARALPTELMAAANPPGTRLLDPERAGDHLDRLFRVAMAYCGSRERAEDLVQDTYVRVLSKPRFLRHDDDLGYLVRVLRNMFISQHRRDSSRPALATADEIDRFEDGSARQPHEVAEGRLVYEAIAALPPQFPRRARGRRRRRAQVPRGRQGIGRSRRHRDDTRVQSAPEGRRDAPAGPLGGGKGFAGPCVLAANPIAHRKDLT